jgi:hypothetical protein
MPLELQLQPVTPERWEDLQRLFGKHGAYGGCWCMWWRIKHTRFEGQKGNRIIESRGRRPRLSLRRRRREIALQANIIR